MDAHLPLLIYPPTYPDTSQRLTLRISRCHPQILGIYLFAARVISLIGWLTLRIRDRNCTDALLHFKHARRLPNAS